MEAIEALDPEHLCTDYWAGKNEREAAAAGLPMPSRAGAGRQAGAPRRRGNKRSRYAWEAWKNRDRMLSCGQCLPRMARQ